MGVLWWKILRDVWGNKGRTLQVVLIIGLGAAAIGMIIGTRSLMIPGMQNIWQSSNPAMIFLYIYPSIDEGELQALRRVEGVETIEGFSTTTIEWRLSPQDEWSQANLTALPDYENQQLFAMELVSGVWPANKVMSTEQGADNFFGIPIGGEVYLRVDEREVKVPINGTLYNPLSTPAYFGAPPQFYASMDYFEYLVGNREFNRAYVNAAVWDEAAVTDLADRLQDKLEQQGKDSGRGILDPNKHYFQDQMDGLFYLLGVFAALALALGLLLVYNTMNAIISRQVNQIGVLKAVGARTWQVLRLFIVAVLIYGLLATLLAVPSGIMGAWGVSAWLVGSFGADLGDFEISMTAVYTMLAITLLAPLLAALFPIFSGARVTVREAISTYGLNKKTGLIERLGARLRHVSRIFLLTIGNTFRNKGRVLLTQIALVLSGLIFMMVVSVRDSIIFTVNDVIFDILGADVTLLFEQGERIEYIQDLAMANPQVRRVELWALYNATVRPAGQPKSEDDESILIWGVPLPTEMYGYQLREGRWLDPSDSYAIVLNRKLLDDINEDLAPEDQIDVGDWVTIQYSDNQARDWQVVGLVFDPLIPYSSNVSRDVLLRDLHSVGTVGSVWIDTVAQDPAGQIATAKALREYFELNNVDISPQRGIFGGMGGDATVETAQTFINQFQFVIILLGFLAIIIGAVGSIGLSGTISLSVLERVREIGVMRAIGASSWDVSRLFIGEGLILGWLSWLIALPLSLPAGRFMIVALGQAFQQEYVYHYTPTGAFLWLGIITILSILASWLPARRATHVSVRESLAYQ